MIRYYMGNANKLVDELQAQGILEQTQMSFFPKENGLEIRFNDIKETVIPIYEQILVPTEIEISPEVLDENGVVLVEAVTEMQDVVVNGELLEEVITYTKRTIEDVEVAYVEMVNTEVAVLDDDNNTVLDELGNEVTEIIQVPTDRTRIEKQEILGDFDPTQLFADIQTVVDAHDGLPYPEINPNFTIEERIDQLELLYLKDSGVIV